VRSISAPRTLRIDGAMYVRVDRQGLDLVLLKILHLAERDARGEPLSLEAIVQQYQQSHPDLSSEAVQARLTDLQLAGLVARHARGPGGQLGGSTTFEAYSLTGKGLGFVGASTSVAAMPTKRGAGLLLVTTRHVLLLKRSSTVGNPGTWGLAGGQLNPAEDPWSGALREVREEIGRVPRPLTVRHHYVRHVGHRHFDVYVVRVPSSVRTTWRPRLNSEHTDWRWFRSDRLPSKLHPVVAWLTQTHQEWSK